MNSSSATLKKCDFCAYQSVRSFNVFRHVDRIHSPKKCRTILCCNKRFLTKGEYYGHVEEKHPHTRKGYVSRTKYKIIKPYLKAFKIKAELAKQKIQKRTHQVKSNPSVKLKHSIRIRKTKSERPADVKSKVLEKSVPPNACKSSKRKFEEIAGECDKDNCTNEEFKNHLPVKKRILQKLAKDEQSGPVDTPLKLQDNKILQENIPPGPLKLKDNEILQENITAGPVDTPLKLVDNEILQENIPPGSVVTTQKLKNNEILQEIIAPGPVVTQQQLKNNEILQENIAPGPVFVVTQQKLNINEIMQGNIAPEVCLSIKLDPVILSPQTQRDIADYLHDITFENYKIF